jgi:hypothetical protein
MHKCSCACVHTHGSSRTCAPYPALSVVPLRSSTAYDAPPRRRPLPRGFEAHRERRRAEPAGDGALCDVQGRTRHMQHSSTPTSDVLLLEPISGATQTHINGRDRTSRFDRKGRGDRDNGDHWLQSLSELRLAQMTESTGCFGSCMSIIERSQMDVCANRGYEGARQGYNR